MAKKTTSVRIPAALLTAVKEVVGERASEYTGEDASCHVNLCSAARCGRCSRIFRAKEVLRQLERLS